MLRNFLTCLKIDHYTPFQIVSVLTKVESNQMLLSTNP